MKKRTRLKSWVLTSLFSLTMMTSLAWADTIIVANDPAGDFAASYTGPKNGDLDILKTSGTQDGSVIQLSALLNGNVGTTTGGFYVFGIDRGAGTARFGTITTAAGTYDATGVKFDAVVIFRPGTSLTVNDLITGASTTLSLSNVKVNGAGFDVFVPVSLFPSQGLSLSQYSFNLWSRVGTITGNGAIPDFGPNNSNVQIAQTPEPATFLLLGAGLAGMALRKRRRTP